MSRKKRIRRKAHEEYISIASIEATEAQIEKASRYLAGVKDGTDRALLNAMRRAMTEARTAGAYKVLEVYALRTRYTDVKNAFCMTKRPKRGDLTGLLTSRGSKFPASRFPYRPRKETTGGNRRLVRLSVKRDGGFKPLGQAFVHNSEKYGNIWQRVGKTSYPIRPVYALSIPEMLGNKDVVEVVEKTLAGATEKRLDHEIYRLLNGFEGKKKW